MYEINGLTNPEDKIETPAFAKENCSFKIIQAFGIFALHFLKEAAELAELLVVFLFFISDTKYNWRHLKYKDSNNYQTEKNIFVIFFLNLAAMSLY